MHATGDAHQVTNGRRTEGEDGVAAAVLDMLQVRASDALPGWLAQCFAKRHPGCRSRVLRVFPGTAARSRTVPRYAVFSMENPMLLEPPLLMGIDAPLVEAIHEARIWTAVAAEPGTRCIATLANAGEVRYVVELTGVVHPSDEEALATLAEIANRYYERLIDAETDPLTRLANRRAFHSHLEAGLKRWTSSTKPWFFAMLDIDHFKRVNDEFGHLYGDEILVRFANLLRATFRTGDLLYRFGGEEFVLVFGCSREEDGAHTLDRFRQAVESYPFPGVGRVTVSAGFARITDGSTPATSLIDRADRALYSAKAHGRNRVCRWEKLVAAGELEPLPPNRDVTIFD